MFYFQVEMKIDFGCPLRALTIFAPFFFYTQWLLATLALFVETSQPSLTLI